MRSFRARLVVATASVALLAIVLTTWAIAATTQDAIVDQLVERDIAEFEITQQLTYLAFETSDWADATDVVQELAGVYDTRIVLTDLNGRPLVDSGSGDLPNNLTGLIDAQGPQTQYGAEFDVGFTDEELFWLAGECLTEQEIPHTIDEFGLVVDDEADFVALDQCYDEAFESLSPFAVEDVAEPAYLFVDYKVEPQIPWVQLGTVAAVVLTLALAAAAISGGVISGPIRKLTTATHSIRAGDLGARVASDSSDELGELAESFNEMANTLEGADRRRKQLTSDVAHELRSPVTNIIGHLDAVEDGVSEPTPEHLGVISAEAQRLHRLIEDLGQLAEADEGAIHLFREEEDVGAIVRRAVYARKMVAADRSISLTCDCPTAMAAVDGARVEQVLGNLLDNALTAVGDGGAVSAVVSMFPGEIRIDVTDDGPGIPDELLDSLFDRLRRGDKARSPGDSGRGLGLAIARALMRAHGGDITATNNTERGARFTVVLPI